MHKTLAALTITTALLIPGLGHLRSASANASTAPSVVDTRPESDLTIGTSNPQISARFSAAASIDPASVRLTVDGTDVTGVATITTAYVSYVPVTPMSNGRHTAWVGGQAFDGTPFSDTWTFLVDSGVSSSDWNQMWSFAPSPFGYPGYGFYPPGFSLFTPGPIFIVAGDFVQVIFFSPFSPFGTGFVTIGGIPGRYFLTPWFGCPGYYWASIPVPFGPLTRNAVLSAHFTTRAGQTVIVHSTTPLQVDGTRRTLPSTVRYASEPVFLNHPTSPQQFVKFVRVVPGANTPIASAPVVSVKPIAPVIFGARAPVSQGTRQLQLMPAAGVPVTNNAARIQIPPSQAVRIMNPRMLDAQDSWDWSRFSPALPSIPMTRMPHAVMQFDARSGATQQH